MCIAPRGLVPAANLVRRSVSEGAVEQSQLELHREAFDAALKHFRFCLARARQAHSVRERADLAELVMRAHCQALAVVKDFLAEGEPAPFSEE